MYDKKYLARNYNSQPVNKLSQYSVIGLEIDNILKFYNRTHLNICELGCGDGRQLRSVAKAYPNIKFTGIDFLVRPSTNDNMNLVKGNLLDKLHELFEDGSIHLVYGIDILEHLTCDELFVLAKILKEKMAKGGTFLARVPNLDSKAGQENQFGDITHKTAFNRHSAKQFMDVLDLANQEIFADNNLVKIFYRHRLKKLANITTKIFTKHSPNIYLRGFSA